MTYARQIGLACNRGPKSTERKRAQGPEAMSQIQSVACSEQAILHCDLRAACRCLDARPRAQARECGFEHELGPDRPVEANDRQEGRADAIQAHQGRNAQFESQMTRI